MSWFATNLIASFLLPPLNLLLIGIAGLLLWYKRPRLARLLVASSFASLWIFSTPFVAEAGLHSLEESSHAVDTRMQDAEAIVVLGGGTYFNAPEYGADTVGDATLIRLRYAARLYHATSKPILVTGGTPLGNQQSEASQMKSVLEQEFRVPVAWTEDASNNTDQNALYSYMQLHKLGIRRIYLLTHAWHMPRAAMAFRRAGFEVVEAPTAFSSSFRTDIFSFIPNAHALHDSQIFMHECIGLLWYRLKYKF
jgi:uncharacterized SAM-binding protein YcdF (DUF218 family)